MKKFIFTKWFTCTKNLSWIVLLFVLFGINPMAHAGNYLTGEYTVTVKPQDQTVGRGKGKVYLDGKGKSLYENETKWGDKSDSDNANIYDSPQSLELSISQKNENRDNQKKPWIQYTSITLRAEALPGSEFVEWEWSSGNSTEKSISLPCPEAYQMQNTDGETKTWTASSQYTAKFIVRTYYAYKQPNDYEVITIDQAGNIINDDLMVAVTPTFGLRAVNNRTNVSTDVFAQTADNNGEKAQASYIWDITAHDAPCHTYYGWKTTEGNYNTVEANNKACAVYTTSEKSNAPAQHTVYVVYKRDPFNMMEYDAENKITAALAMPYSVENGIQTYTENIPGAELTTKYYRLVIGAIGNVTIASEGDFSAELATEDGKQILIVTPGDNAQEGTIYISVGGTQIAALHLTVNVQPVYVTLNPAEDLTGTYTYTQSTTGTQVFSITTSPVVKQMVTATDYSFSFTPTPQDATKYQFDRWIIRDALGNTIAESVEPNLTYTFKGDESITPVFTAKDRAVFIVKSEPDVKYLDLQEALDRAAALTTNRNSQTVVVTVEGTRKGGRLVQGDYVIRNGVTLLVPGESTYKEMIGDRTENDFERGTPITTYCTLTVDDNTTITLENGNISIYGIGEMATGDNYFGIVHAHGHMQLGKNCQIVVKEDGGLYAFGFITGDNSSHITMESGSEVYEYFSMLDWRGGSEAMGNWMSSSSAGAISRVFPIGQYYIQTIEVPMTLKAGATEVVSCCVDAGITAHVNMDLISTYSAEQCLFGLGDGTSITKSYDPLTDRIKFELDGTGLYNKDDNSGSHVKIGSMNLKISKIVTIDVSTGNYVMPIQNNIDLEVKNTTIDVKYDLAFLPGSLLRVHDDAVINVEENANIYVYDRGARKLDDGSSYWLKSSSTKPLVPLASNARPGNVQYSRTDADLVDARLIINGDMNIYGGLYTVKGAHAEADSNDPDAEGGADITSEGSGKINVYKIGAATHTNQWLQGNGAQSLALTTPNLLLHNDLSKGADNAYTPVNAADISYTYYQYDGTWRAPEPGITGVKLYDSENNEIDVIHVTLPTAEVNGYILATLEPIKDQEYALTDFTIPGKVGEVILDKNNATIVEGKLKIPFLYTAQNKHGVHTADLTITYTKDADYTRVLTMPVVAEEDYTPIFTASEALNLYGCIDEDNIAALPIQYSENNVITLSEDNVNLTWTSDITGTNNDQFSFAFGEGEGNMLSGAKVIFKPTSQGTKTATLTLTARYEDSNNPVTERTKVHTVSLVGNALTVANTLDFSSVGTIKTTTQPFELLKNINSPGAISVTLEQVGSDEPNAVVDIKQVDSDVPNSNYIFTPKAVGQVKVKVTQDATTKHDPIEIEKIFVVVADPIPLTEISCVTDETNFKSLTANVSNIAYTNGQIQFMGEGAPAVWTAQFASMPGTLSFTPNGDGHWAVQESKDGRSWSEIIWWTRLPNAEDVTIPLTPSSRYLQIQYINAEAETHGYITDLCINPFSIHAEATKLYVPVEGGSVRSTSIVFTHAAEPNKIQIVGPEGWEVTTNASGNIGGLKNPYYETIVTLSGGQDVVEQNNGFTLTATQTTDNTDATVTLATYNFPRPLPMQSAQWKSDDNMANNENGYDEAEYYNLYLHDSEYAKWDAATQTVVFMNKGTKSTASRQVSFGYHGLPSELRFESLSTDWVVEEGVEATEGVAWTPTNKELRSIVQNDGKNIIIQPINHTSKFVRITYEGGVTDEVTIQNIVIEGFPNVIAPAKVEITKASGQSNPSAIFDIHVMNISRIQLVLDNTTFSMSHDNDGDWEKLNTGAILSAADYPEIMQMNEGGDISIKVEWGGTNVVNEGYLTILNPDQENKVMAKVRLVGKKDGITAEEASTGIWTGVPDGQAEGRPTDLPYTLVGATGDNKVFEEYPYHEVNIKNAFALDETALFDYVIIYGETTTKNGSRTITRPNTDTGSNAKTPYYIYQRSEDKLSYRFIQAVENANSPLKADLSEITHFTKFEVGEVKYYAIQPKNKEPLSIYITGFCPYATTGSTKDDEGVWYFRGEVDDQVHIYLEDCHIYSRTKSISGHITSKKGTDSPSFDEGTVKGSGAVLVFENANPQQDNSRTFNVAIHTKGHNVLKSNYGCFYNFLFNAKATQISSPVQVRLGDATHFQTARTMLDFDDLWPQTTTFSYRTNGFLSLQKQSNNAPSIDLGNAHTVVNFRGGQVQLQNAQIVSPNYKTTLAISYRSGLMTNMEIPMAYGIGTDEVGGTVNFYDGTTTVLAMPVQEEYRSYYLMDTDASGNELTTTSCLRTPTNTYVYGGSHCMMRACNHVTSKGGAPKDGPEGKLLGRYVYNNTNENQRYTYACVVENLPNVDEYQDGYELIYDGNRYILQGDSWVKIAPASFADPCYLVTPLDFPADLTIQSTGQKLLDYYYEKYPDKEYGLSSVTPDANGNLSFWVPGGVFPDVTPEEDKLISAWKACMTEIGAGAFGYDRRIGGTTSIEFNEEVTNLLYCQLDNNIHSILTDRTEIGEDDNQNPVYQWNYKAPVVDPTGQLPYDKKYMSVSPTYVSDSVQHSIVSKNDYKVTSKIYYVTTALADTWMNFTMPFDVEKIWVVEPYWESKIEEYYTNPIDKKEGESNLEATLRFQARHNADFAAFFAVAMAIGDNSKDFNGIFADYKKWAKECADRTYVDSDGNHLGTGYYDGTGEYTLRDRYALTHYDGSNFNTAHYYLYKNTRDWSIQSAEASQFTTSWEIVPKVPSGQAIMKAGQTYSLLFPYCLGCDAEVDGDGNLVLDSDGLPSIKDRDYWDYWTGKFLIFESTRASEKAPHVIKGSYYVGKEKVGEEDWIFDNHPSDPTTAVLHGNSTFTMLHLNDYSKKESVYTYISVRQAENFRPVQPIEGKYPIIPPTNTFLMNGNPTRAKLITRTGRIIYDQPDDNNNGNQNGTSGGHMPTVGGGNDLFVTSIAGGINVAVAAPQNVRVLSSTGAVIYSGYIQTAVDIKLPTNGIYIVSGENEVQKILY